VVPIGTLSYKIGLHQSQILPIRFYQVLLLNIFASTSTNADTGVHENTIECVVKRNFVFSLMTLYFMDNNEEATELVLV